MNWFYLCLLSSYFEFFCIFSSFRSFSQPLVFKTIDSDDIAYVENYVRNDLRELIEMNENFDPEHKVFVFGKYASHPENFSFNRGEKKLINALVEHVKQVVDSDGFAMFNPKNKTKVKSTLNAYLCDTGIGSIFGRQNSISLANKKPEDADEMLKKLISKGKHLFDSFKLERCAVFSDNLFELKRDEGKIGASIRCIFCDDNAVNNVVKVNRAHSNTGDFWVMSNLKSHILRFHCSKQLKKQQKQQKIPKMKTNGAQIVDDFDDDLIGTTTDNSDSNGTIVELVINPVDTHDLVEQLQTQIWTQNLRLENMAQQNTETKFDFFVDKTASKHGKIEAFQIDPDGDCVFAALAHQIFCVKIRSSQHHDFTRNLRKEVVQFIKDNFNSYEFELRGRVFEIDSNKSDKNIQKKCHFFLNDYLPKEKVCWGGIESIKAISQMYEVNVVVINDDGTCNLPIKFDPTKKCTIMIGYSSNGHNNNRNHYDSIASISDFFQTNFSTELIHTDMQQQNFFSGAIQKMPIELED